MFIIKRARKKKWLTEPVEFIPFPNQSLRNNLPVTPKVTNQSVGRILSSENPEPKMANIPGNQLNTLNVSIKKLLEKKQEEQQNELSISNLPDDSFSMDQLKMLWRKYAFEVKEKGLETFYNAMIKRDVYEMGDNQFAFEVDNHVQVDYIKPHMEHLNTYLKKELNNYKIEIILRLNQDEESEIKFLTGKDKFALLSKKNPYLHTFKQTFNLDIEY